MDKKIDAVWRVSLLILCIVTVIRMICSWTGVLLPDVWVRMMGILEIAALPALVYAGVKKNKIIRKFF